MLDYYSFYQNVVRNLIFKKISLVIDNSYKLPTISKVVYCFRLYQLENLDSVQIYNYLYLFKFFFGRRGSLTKYKSFYNLGS